MSNTTVAPILGTMTFGGQVSAADAARIVGLYLDSGYRDLDTAYVYGEGRTEEVLGAALRGRDRATFTVASKVHPMVHGDLRLESIRAQLESSLRRLGLDSVDLLYLHHPDLATPMETTLEACQRLHEAGLFRALGMSNYAAWQVADAWHVASRRGWIQPTVYQGMYNALTRDVDRELFPCIRALGIRFTAYNPLAGGLLTNRYRAVGEVPGSGRFGPEAKAYRDRYWKESYFQALDRIREACDGTGMPVAQGALRWLLHHSRLAGVRGDAVIIGGSSVEHIALNLEAWSGGALAPAAVVAFDEAWDTARPSCPKYFRP
jgi:aflatoxin B1 aldehyde reductase